MNKKVLDFLKDNPEWQNIIEEAMTAGLSYKIELFITAQGKIKDKQYKSKRLLTKKY